jgi:tRNA pseudouridine13 synthase
MIDLEASGPYTVYELKKAGWNTPDALARLARSLGVPHSIFSYGGRKDRHALTTQVVTARSSRDLTIDRDGCSLAFMGRSSRPMGPDLIKSNKFEISLRSMSNEEVATVDRREYHVSRLGCPNFFDDQRFGSMDIKRGFVAERILKHHWRGAVELFLTAEHRDESPEQRERREFYAANWDNWEACGRGARNPAEHDMILKLCQKPPDYVGALQAIPAPELSMMFSAYQAFLWNEMLRRYLCRLDISLGQHQGDAGPYLFYDDLSGSHLEKLRSLQMPTAGSKLAFQDAEVEVLYDSVLLERGLDRGSFNLRRIRQAYFKSVQRTAIVIPQGFSLGEAEADETYDGHLKMTVKFELPRGAYGTMVIKALLTEIFN